MKKTLVFISVLAGMAMTFTGCGANIDITPNVSVNIQETAKVTEIADDKGSVNGSSVEINDTNVSESAEEKEPPVSAVTELSAPAVSEAVSESAQVSETKKETENKMEKYNCICEELKAMAAEGSPLAKGYRTSGFGEMMSRYYNVDCVEDTYSYSLNRDSVMLGTASFLLESEGTVVSACSEKTSGEDEKNYEKLLEFVNSKAGEGSYRIHDAFTEKYTETYGVSTSNVDDKFKHNRTVTGKVRHIEIVLNSDLEKYTAAADADKSKYTVRFEITEDGEMKSEYEYYSRAKEIKKNLLSELNAFSPDYAFGIDQCSFSDADNKLTAVHAPFFSADRKSAVNGEEAEFWLNKNRCVTAVSEKNGDADESDIYTSVYLSVYCRPGTDPASFKTLLEDLYPVTEKYDVTYINIDVLANESDFERYRSCDGSIPEETIISTYRGWHFNNPEFGWGVPGK